MKIRPEKKLSICVLGDGGWGTTLSILLSRKGYQVCLWSAFDDYAAYLDRERINKKFLPGVLIPGQIKITADMASALSAKDLVVLAVPSEYLRQVLKKVRFVTGYNKSIYLSAVKGVETGSLLRMSQVIHEELGPVDGGVLSGPTIANEVARGVPSTAVVASKSLKTRKLLQSIFMTDYFRVYTNEDVIGVELGGSFKNVIAIACGISDGLGFGTNTKSAIVTRGIVEIAKLGHALGAKVSTFYGISGLGDLATTCFSPFSRNRSFGEQIGKGNKTRFIKKHMQMVAEGLPTARSAYELGIKKKVDLPIINEVYKVLYRNKSPRQAVCDLMTRKEKEEIMSL